MEIDLDFSLAGKIAVITGGASGIGAAIASAYTAKGATVAILDLAGEAAADRAAELGPDHAGYSCDVTDAGSVKAVVAAVHERFQRIDVLVNSAGVALLAPAEELSREAWDTTLAVNLTGAFAMCHAVGRLMLAQGRATA